MLSVWSLPTFQETPTTSTNVSLCQHKKKMRDETPSLKRNRAFTKAVSNMAIMDITDIEPLLMAVYELLQETAEFLPKLSQNGSGDDLSICLLQISSK